MTETLGSVDVAVVGRSLPALLAALDFAEVGLSVVVIDEVASVDEAESPSSAERDPNGELAWFMGRIAAPEASPREGAPSSPWLRDPAGVWAAQPEPAVFGIPAVPLSHASLRLLGTGGALRAYLDRLVPLLTIGKTRSFGVLVRKRLGRAARERLVQPLVQERFGVDADHVDASIIAPGLNEALSRTGSLTAAALAYSERHVARETTVRPESGWGALESAVLERLMYLDAKMLHGSVTRVEQGDDAWAISLGELAETEVGAGAERDACVSARAVVIDHPRSIAEWASRAALLDIDAELPSRVRLHAEIDIYPPSGAPADSRLGGDSGIDAEFGTAFNTAFDAVETIEGWAVRLAFERSSPGAEPIDSNGAGWHATLSGPVRPGVEAVGYEDELASILSSAGLRARVEPQATRAADTKINAENSAETESGPGIQTARNTDAEALADPETNTGIGAEASAESHSAKLRAEWRAAPFATTEQRDLALASLRKGALENPSLLRTGRSLHGDDLAAALASAHSGAIALRRHLLGLTE